MNPHVGKDRVSCGKPGDSAGDWIRGAVHRPAIPRAKYAGRGLPVRRFSRIRPTPRTRSPPPTSHLRQSQTYPSFLVCIFRPGRIKQIRLFRPAHLGRRRRASSEATGRMKNRGHTPRADGRLPSASPAASSRRPFCFCGRSAWGRLRSTTETTGRVRSTTCKGHRLPWGDRRSLRSVRPSVSERRFTHYEREVPP